MRLLEPAGIEKRRLTEVNKNINHEIVSEAQKGGASTPKCRHTQGTGAYYVRRDFSTEFHVPSGIRLATIDLLRSPAEWVAFACGRMES